MKTWIVTLVGNLYWVVGTLTMGTLALLVGWIPPRGSLTFHVARLWSRGALLTSGARLDVSFEEPLASDGRYIYMANHQSMYDIPALLVSLPGQTRFMAKRSLFRIPIFGWAIAQGGFIPVDRVDRSRARETFAAAVERLREGASVLVFPEETRGDGVRLLPFQRGGFLLAIKSGLPIVPVGVRGTRAIRPKGSVRIVPGPVGVAYGKPIDVAGLGVSDRRALVERVRERVAELAGADAETADNASSRGGDSG